VLVDVDLTVRAGEFVAVVGASGSGKSTLLNLAAGIDLPTAGDVALAGNTINHLSERGRTLLRRSRVGFVFQFFNLIPSLTVRDNLLLPLELCGVRRAEALERVQEALKAVGLDDRAFSYPDALSGGEQQRVAVGRAVVHRPAVVLADEPTGNLDAAAGENVLRLMRALTTRYGSSILMATHSRDAAHSADRVVSVLDGSITEAGA
jgi:putative ABC transport system ATP-binding protein